MLPAHPPYRSLALLSASALGYEVLLMRLFSIIQWHHFAYLVIALALLGYGISGSLLSLPRNGITHHYRGAYLLAILLFALAAPAAYLLAQAIPFNVEELLWDYRQSLLLALLFLLLALPFVFAATAICMTFMVFPEQRAPAIYAADLFGAGCGALGVTLLMYLLTPERILVAISLLGLSAGVLGVLELQLPKPRHTQAIIGVAMLLLLGATPSLQLHYSPYKGLSQALRVKGTQVIETRSSPLGLLSLIRSDRVPLRHAPGLSLLAEQEPPRQLGLFTDADNMMALTAYPANLVALAYLDQTSAALPYHLGRPAKLLVIGAGTGADLLLAHYHGVNAIDALELNPQVIELVREHRAFAGALYDRPGTRIQIAEAREFLGRSPARYDLIQMALVDAAGASASGLYALNESYLYTREALRDYLSHLAPEGYLSITRWIKLPPRDSLKLFATALAAMKTLDLPDIPERLVMIRSWQTSTLLIKNGRFGPGELAVLKAFCRQRLFDIAYAPGLDPAEGNRYNRLDQPLFFRATRALAGQSAEDFIERYKFDIRPASDDRPYFHHFFKWSSFFEAYALRGKGGMPLIEWGYVILVVTLALTAVISALFILFPLALRPGARSPQTARWRIFGYFFGIGLAFLFIEIACIQKFLLFLHRPIQAIATVLSAFLIFAGLGSLSCQSLIRRRALPRLAFPVIGGITLLSLAYLTLLDPLFHHLGHLPLAAKMALSVLLIAPLATLMGMPFPLAVTALKSLAPVLLPWAWGINGYASVISSTLATLIAIHFGFAAVMLCATGLYLLALILFPRQPAPSFDAGSEQPPSSGTQN